jgi:Leucine-rich repeat (LRR) protein
MAKQAAGMTVLRLTNEETSKVKILDISENLMQMVSGLPSSLKKLIAHKNFLTSIILPDGIIYVDLNDNNFLICPVLPYGLQVAYFADNKLYHLYPHLPKSLKELDVRDNPIRITPELRMIPQLYSDESTLVPAHEETKTVQQNKLETLRLYYNQFIKKDDPNHISSPYENIEVIV